jgi:hypothetical protein
LRFERTAELGLAAGSLEEHDELARDRECNPGAEVLFDECQGKVDPGSDTG